MSDWRALVAAAAAMKRMEAVFKEKKATLYEVLRESMEPGESQKTPLATVIRSADTTRVEWHLAGDLLAWAKEHRPDAVVHVPAREDVAEWLIPELIKKAEETGEVPDCLEPKEVTRPGNVQVRQTQAQAEETMARLTSGELSIGNVLEIGS